MYDTQRIFDVVSGLKEIKASSFHNKNGLVDFIKAKETCRIIDTFILPIYYIWEHFCNRNLEELEFEEHLKKPYHKFLHNPFTYTWELYLFISISPPFVKQLGGLSRVISRMYKELIDYHTNTCSTLR